MEKTNQTQWLKGLLLLQTLGVCAYTAIAMGNDGFNFLEKALAFCLSLTWMGQFTLDFSCYLTLSGLWIAWRHQFTGKSIAMALVAATFGIIAFAPYLLYLLMKEKGDLKSVLLGDRK
jgi:hypothetical protein